MHNRIFVPEQQYQSFIGCFILSY